jgi:hypothetical protein
LMKRLLALASLLLPTIGQAQITLEHSDGGATQCGFSVTTCELPTPTNDSGEFLVAFCGLGNGSTAANINETGFGDQIYNINTSGTDSSVVIELKESGGTEPANITCDSDTGTASFIVGEVFTYSGIDSTTAIDATAVDCGGRADNTTYPASDCSITTVTDGAYVCSVVHKDSSHTTLSMPGGAWTTILDIDDAGFSNNPRLGVACQTKATAGVVTLSADSWGSANAATDWGGVLIALRPASSGPTFTTGPTVAAATNGFTISGTLSGTGTLTAYAVGVNPGDGAPTCTQIKAGQNDGGTSADISANEVWTTDVADSFTVTRTGAWPRYNVHVCGSDGTNDTSVTTSNNQNRSADASQAITVSTSVSGTSAFALQSENTCDTTTDSATITGCADTSWLQVGMLVDLSAGFADLTDVIVTGLTSSTITLENEANSTTANITVTQDAYYSPTVAAGDVVEGDTTNSEGDSVTVGADLEISWTDTCGGCYTTWDYNIQDVSDVVSGDFDAGPPTWSNGDDTMHFFSTAPSWGGTAGDPIVLDYNTAMTTISLDAGNYCTDSDSQAMTIAVRSGTLPTGVTLTNNDLSGTPTVEDESGATINFTCTDTGGLVAAQDITLYVVDTVTMPTLDDSDIDAALDDAAAAVPWRDYGEGVSSTFSCSTEASQQVMSQSPAASTEVSADQVVSLVVSVSAAPCGKRFR